MNATLTLAMLASPIVAFCLMVLTARLAMARVDEPMVSPVSSWAAPAPSFAPWAKIEVIQTTELDRTMSQIKWGALPMVSAEVKAAGIARAEARAESTAHHLAMVRIMKAARN